MNDQTDKYVPPHMRKPKKDNLLPPENEKTLMENNIRVKTNSPYPPISSLSSIMCAKALSFTCPTPIQKYSIPIIMNGHPFLCRAPTGMGKTLTYLLPLIENIRYKKGVQICIVAPTRELCDQIKDEASIVCKSKGLKVQSMYGKKAVLSEYNSTDILVAAPGRLLDMLETKRINFSNVEAFVLDEADKLLEMGFERDVKAIRQFVSQDAQVCLFSATYHKNLDGIIKHFLPNSKYFVEIENETVENIKQDIVSVSSNEDKDSRLKAILSKMDLKVSWKGVNNPDKILIFVERKSTAAELESKIKKMGYDCVSIHGDKEQSERTSCLEKFKKGNVPILVATSVAARGIDVKDIKLVVNYDFPRDIKDYIHRIGRTGREGKSGESIAFLEMASFSKEMRYELINILKESKNTIPEFLYKEHRPARSDYYRYEGKSNAMFAGKDSYYGARENVLRRDAKADNLVRSMEDLSLHSETEKADSDDDVPGAW
jgi:probable ATP-dependent RNA helicase DDX4